MSKKSPSPRAQIRIHVGIYLQPGAPLPTVWMANQIVIPVGIFTPFLGPSRPTPKLRAVWTKPFGFGT
jgi:hypothetical protein